MPTRWRYMRALVTCAGVAILDPAVAMLDFWLGSVSAAWRRRRGGRRAYLLCRRQRRVRFLSALRTKRGAPLPRHSSALGSLCRHSARWRGGGAHHSADQSHQPRADAVAGDRRRPERAHERGRDRDVEYLLIPLVFGLGGPLVAMVGTNIGAHRPV